MIRRPPRSTLSSSSAASDVYKRQSQEEWPLPASPGSVGGGHTTQLEFHVWIRTPSSVQYAAQHPAQSDLRGLHGRRGQIVGHRQRERDPQRVSRLELEVNGHPVSYTHLRAHETVLDL